MKVTVVTPSYPRYTGDYHGSFIQAQCQRLSRHVELTVLAPRSRTMQKFHEAYPVFRFPYMPTKRMELVAERTMKDAPIPYLLQLPPYLLSAYLHSVKLNGDIIHTHLAIPLGVLMAHNPRKTPQIITCHGSDCTLPLKNPIYLPFTRHALRKADRVITVSEYIRDIAIRLGAEPEKTRTIYIGVDVNRFRPVRRRNHAVTLGTLGRLVPEKNIEDILHAVKRLEDSLDLELIIGGDGPHRSELTRTAKRLGLQNIRFLGRVHDAKSFHRRCDVFILASTSEGLSISLQEAMASGSVPVAVNGYGCDEVVSDNVNGYLYEPRNVNELTNKIRNAVQNLGLGKTARETIVRDFDIDKNTVKLLEVYNEFE
ncbi:MAG: glycosyltransferase family 4 protein [Candidatus Bathyarchaeota archaeon]|nr:glycosyltransferase family 4 protein [Candidatus Bathyarchaeota archaeon]